MTSVFVIAAVFLGAEGESLQLKQPVIAQQAAPAVVVLDSLREEEASPSVTGGLIKPVAYQSKPSKVNLAPVASKASYSVLQDESPSDAMPQPMQAMPTPPKPVMPSEIGGADLGEPYVASADYSLSSCGATTEGDSCGCESAHGCNLGCGCGHGGCGHGGCGCGHGHGGFYAHHCLPSPWHAPGNMAPHRMYDALPKTYYYFRPYNMLMIPDQQAQAAAWVENPHLPYSNGVFQKVYAELEPVLNAPGEIISAPPIN
ncbi:hypothetical protein AB1L30_26385 [Bremerella sp. JC817]|uniref:hypothetical protein n=1 Tax=Bremerella sp. JC817 TaxID=3231756 RepID=UPI003458073D